MGEKELSNLTHIFDMWNSKKERIDAGEVQIPIIESDITEKDIALFNQIIPEYPIKNPGYHVIVMNNKRFVTSDEDYKRLSEVHYNTLEKLSNEDNLFNPIYISIEEDGGLLVD